MKFMLISLGIWPDASCVTFCRIFWSITIATLQFWHYRYFLTHYHSIDMFDFMEWCSSFLGYWKLFTKYVCFWLNQRIFDKILTMMAEDWSDCSNSDIEMRTTADKAKTSDYVTNALIALHSLAVLLYGTSVLLADVDVTNRTIDLTIHKIEVPFNINTQRTYKIVLITEIMYMLAAGVGNSIPNILLLTFSRAIGLAAYNCQWYDLAPKQSRVLLFIILRSQKQLTLTVGKMTDLSLRCFASIMNSAASYLSVLLAMQ
nr:PREDICTED: uncharacterized protein LOC105670844 [Linepithema humile]